MVYLLYFIYYTDIFIYYNIQCRKIYILGNPATYWSIDYFNNYIRCIGDIYMKNIYVITFV